MKKIILLGVLIVAFIFSASKIVNINMPRSTENKVTKSYTEITPQNLSEKDLFIGKSTVAIIDLRSNEEYLKERIPGSVKRSSDEIVSIIPELEQNYLTLVFVSGDGVLAEKAAQQVADNSTRFSSKQIFVLKGGMAAWTSANLPTVSSD